MKSLRRHGHSRGQFGAVLPIAAVMTTVIIFILFSVGLDMALLKYAQIKLRASVDLMCQRVAFRSTVQRQAALVFEREIETLKASPFIDHAKIVNARLILPTMPDDGAFPSSADPYLPTLPANFCRYTGDSTATCGSGLWFGSDVRDAATFPAAAWNNADNAGNAVGCEVEAEYPSFGLAFRRAPSKVKVMWWSPVRGPQYPTVTGTTPSRPGLTIGVATQLLTRVQQRRFRFRSKGALGNDLYDDSFQNVYDPLRRWTHAPFRAVKFQNGADSSFDANNRLLGLPALSSSSYGGASRTVTGEYDAELGANISSDLEEMLTACMNPAVLVRNTLLSTIVELASRHGQLRSMTEILHLNSRIPSDPSRRVPPVRLVTFQEDLAQPAYQLPYVMPEWFSGSNWRSPFYGTSESRSAEKDYRVFLASQLRACYQLMDYDKSSDASGVARYADEPLWTDLDNTGFQPGVYAFPVPPSSDLPRITPGVITGPRWDQECPWGGSACAMSSTRRITAAEIMAGLGSSQPCPYPIAVDGSGTTCVKSAATPDLLAFMRYAAPMSSGTHTALSAAVAPGLFPYNRPAEPLPFDANLTVPATHFGSHILLVLHSIELDTNEKVGIRDLVNSLQTGSSPRPITIVFIPATKAESDAGVEILRQAFKGVPVSSSHESTFDSPLGSLLTTIYVLSPYYQATPSPVGDEEDVFGQYWSDLLNDQENSVVKMAEALFTYRILMSEMKY